MKSLIVAAVLSSVVGTVAFAQISTDPFEEERRRNSTDPMYRSQGDYQRTRRHAEARYQKEKRDLELLDVLLESVRASPQRHREKVIEKITEQTFGCFSTCQMEKEAKRELEAKHKAQVVNEVFEEERSKNLERHRAQQEKARAEQQLREQQSREQQLEKARLREQQELKQRQQEAKERADQTLREQQRAEARAAQQAAAEAERARKAQEAAHRELEKEKLRLQKEEDERRRREEANQKREREKKPNPPTIRQGVLGMPVNPALLDDPLPEQPWHIQIVATPGRENLVGRSLRGMRAR